MVSGKHKSRSMRRVFVKAPGNTVKMHFKIRKPAKAVCSKYGTVLQGVARGTKAELRNMPKTMKRPERPFGGVLCSKAMREEMKKRARAIKA